MEEARRWYTSPAYQEAKNVAMGLPTSILFSRRRCYTGSRANAELALLALRQNWTYGRHRCRSIVALLFLEAPIKTDEDEANSQT